MKSLCWPQWVISTAAAAACLVLLQFVLAGTALFVKPSLWGLHGAVGGAVSLPVVALLYQTRRNTFAFALRSSCWWLLALYCTQLALAFFSDRLEMIALRAAHVSNAALVMWNSFRFALRARSLP